MVAERQDKPRNLQKTKAYINGEWVEAAGGQSFEVTNPANGEVIGSVTDCEPEDVRRAINAADEAFPAWSKRLAKERAAILRKWYELIVDNADDLAMLMTREQGKPLKEAKGEILYGASFVEWYAEEAKRAYGDTIPPTVSGTRIHVIKQPVGVCGMITPWNFPSAMISRKVAPALAAGCTVVCKPASETPFSALALAELAHEAGFPKGVFNVVPSDNARAVGEELCSNPIVRKISFTGSTAVGKILMKQSADTVKKISLELGGNAPFIVFKDADIDAAVDGLIACKFRNAGQTCVSANRVYVQDVIYNEFADRLKTKVEALKVGEGTASNVDIGPLINEAAIDKVKEHIANATDNGADILTGGKPHELGALYFQPTVLKNMNNNMKIACEETFGPVAPLFSFADEEEVIALANNTEYGLASYFYARDMGRVWRVAEALEYGMVAVNAPILSTEVAPFGGVKESGMGREGSKYGLDDYLEIKYILMGGI